MPDCIYCGEPAGDYDEHEACVEQSCAEAVQAELEAIDLFAGPGGWEVAAAELGLDVLGVEWDQAACATREAAGHRTLRADVAALDPVEFGPVKGLIASPPCPSFSNGGKRDGHRDLPTIEHVLAGFAEGEDRRGQVEWHDDRSRFTVEPLRWALALRPEWVALEQVPAVLPVWERIAEILCAHGYGAEARVLHAEQYGVPQTRKRAILVAHRDGARLPEPTQEKYVPGVERGGNLLLQPWVSMAEALGWPEDDRLGFPRLNDRDDGGVYRERDTRPASPPSFALTEKARSWKRYRYNTPDWPWNRPATTLSGDPRVFQPGAHHANDGRRTNPDLDGRSQNAIRLSEEEAARLQTFPDDYPWQGTATKRFQQIGNAVPPLLARRVLEAVAR